MGLTSEQRADLERRLARAVATFSAEVIAILDEIVSTPPAQEQPRADRFPVPGDEPKLFDRVWMTSREAAEYARVSPGAMKRYLASGELRSSQAVPGGGRRIRREWIDEWLEGRGG